MKQKEQPRTLHSAKIRLTKYENLLWKCYAFLQDSYGSIGDDFLAGSLGRLKSIKELSIIGEELKIRLRKTFEKLR